MKPKSLQLNQREVFQSVERSWGAWLHKLQHPYSQSRLLLTHICICRLPTVQRNTSVIFCELRWGKKHCPLLCLLCPNTDLLLWWSQKKSPKLSPCFSRPSRLEPAETWKADRSQSEMSAWPSCTSMKKLVNVFQPNRRDAQVHMTCCWD